MKQLFKLSSSWFPIWLISLLMLVMVFVYLPIFKGAKQNMSDVPLIVVNEDKGKVGDAILLNLIEKQNGNSFKWEVDKSRKQAFTDIRNNKAYGALIIPSDYSKSLGRVHDTLISGLTNDKPADLEILLNEGIGQTASMIASNTLQTVALTASKGISSQLKNELLQKGMRVAPENASLLENPVQVVSKNVLRLPVNLNKGMTPFVMALISSITGMLGANMIHGYLLRSNGILKKRGSALSESEVLTSEIIFGIILTFCVSIFIQLGVFGIFGSAHASNIWTIFLFTFFSCTTMFLLFKTIAVFLGGWGMLVMFPVNFMGIFSSGGAFPLSTLPTVHRLFSYILPTRYIVDGIRALLYYDGRLEAGLGPALLALSIYFVLTLAILIVFINLTKKYKEAAVDESGKKIEAEVGNEIPHEPPTHEQRESHHIGEKDGMFRQAVSNLAKGSNKEKQEMNDNEYRNALKSLDKNKK
ncbi:ABC transporter permease [Priestia megaterium]|uniref:ABC transporter permease n=1 Tax=Priestia megaterium TaxID=1404 RepID=UPI001B3A20CD|nr:ABC transporter permease [Priestia megaterium]MBQ4870428.1 ABC transporter permease [Priestia megaterium]